ncbi:gas vesicle structural protein GvpA [Nonomuraea sp. SMC257]|uniref:Gas vesicle protein A n=1 Tax=Nonomuraea montanisoli TaxID=2741721 RepID=A0A7Y6I3N4_9ACTN|nr:gas vesicle protein GvpJ [Nonomuraea montanisoli]NUW30563.1 gas vesicle structural protein GvpA [Nonomuraea montanisoli]
MTIQPAGGGGGIAQRPSASGLADVIDTILDKGLVIDAYVRVSLVGIELLTIDARIVVASVDTYLRFAEAVNRLDISEQGGQGLPELMQNIKQNKVSREGKSAAQGVLEAAAEKLDDLMGGSGDEKEEIEARPSRRRRRGES